MIEPFQNKAVEEKFAAYPVSIRKQLMAVRQLIFETAADLPAVGELEETLKWGEPSYLTSQTKSGSTIRIDWKPAAPNEYAVYFNCKTTLVADFREIYGGVFRYGGNRSILFTAGEVVPIKALEDCIAMALTYHLKQKSVYSRP